MWANHQKIINYKELSECSSEILPKGLTKKTKTAT